MASPAPDSDIDQLYQLPLGEFVAARNALAKRAGAAAAAVRALVKPTVPAWAINQLYWQKRAIYDALIERAEDLRATHHAALQGRKADLRGATRAHEEAVDAALKGTIALLASAGQPATDATRQAIATTLRELPGDEPAGRLSRALEPRGFDVFGAAASKGRVKIAPPAPAKPPAAKPAARRDAKAHAAARQEAADAARAVRTAEAAARRDEFDAARAAREADKAEKAALEAARRLEAAREALADAESEHEDATRAAARAKKDREAADVRAETSAGVLEKAKEREDAAKAALDTA